MQMFLVNLNWDNTTEWEESNNEDQNDDSLWDDNWDDDDVEDDFYKIVQ